MKGWFRENVNGIVPGVSRFGRWLVVAAANKDKSGKSRWLCRCECDTTRPVLECSLISGKSVSCGCYSREQTRRNGLGNKRHGHSKRQRDGKAKRSPTYIVWMSVMARCYNPRGRSFKRYGAVGIKSCEGMKSFDHFLACMGERPSWEHSIDRIENSRGYDCGRCQDCISRGVPCNCRWATDVQQARNRTNNHVVEFRGQSKTLVEWAHEFGIKPVTLRTRVSYGWPIEKCLLTPVKKKKTAH